MRKRKIIIGDERKREGVRERRENSYGKKSSLIRLEVRN